MAQRRMFSAEIVCSDEFLELSATARELYFQLGMRADDDGFIQPRGIMKLTGASSDDLRVLIAKRFLLPFETGVVVIKHWLIHNMIRGDRYKETRFLEEKKALFIKDNKAYTDNPDAGVPLVATKWQPTGNQLAPQVRLGKVRLKGDFQEKIASPSEITRVNTTTEGEELPPKKKYEHRGTPAWELREEFYKRFEQEKGHLPTPHAGDLVNINNALKAELSEEDCREMVEEALGIGKVRTVREIFSPRAIDIYKQDNL